MSKISCIECRQCNRKGKPSVMKGSAYCDSHILSRPQTNRVDLFDRFKIFLFEKRYDEKTNDVSKNRGFRPSWFWRR